MTARDTDGDELIARVQAAELTGRGGAHFCAATKWRAVRATNQQAVVVVNAAESEPASVKDAALLQLRPHLVLDGVAAAAEATNATEVIVWLHQGSHNTRDSLNQALSERRQAGVVDPEIRFAYGPARYLSGESSAIINALSGGPTLPMFRRRPSSQSGVNERPTLLHNVETFARVGALARTTVRHPVPGTMLTVVSSHGRTVVDVPPNWTLSDAVHHATSFALADVPVTAVLVGGYGGQWIPWPEAQTLPLCEPLTRARGRSLGAGVVAVLPAFTCG
ncbi:MAG TPA: oxidoreductase, partial [Actinomycetes bacterium]|nr:oxidoreductase [Actinomycetes bacterium]